MALLAAMTLFLQTGVLTIRAQCALAQRVVRLHVVARSDAPEDQAVKLEVRDAVLAAADECTADAQTAQEAAAALSAGLDGIEAAARARLRELGEDESVRVSLAREEFSTRAYDTFTLPAGQYTALRVVIGEGEGHNWWCVVFPSLCTAATAEELTRSALSSGLTEGEVRWITDDAAGVCVRFRLLEWLSRLLG